MSSPRISVERLEDRSVPTVQTFLPGSYIIDMGQTTQTVGNALKPYGLVYDMVTNFKVPVEWASNPAKTTFRLALEECGYLHYTRRLIPPPIPGRTAANNR